MQHDNGCCCLCLISPLLSSYSKMLFQSAVQRRLFGGLYSAVSVLILCVTLSEVTGVLII